LAVVVRPVGALRNDTAGTTVSSEEVSVVKEGSVSEPSACAVIWGTISPLRRTRTNAGPISRLTIDIVFIIGPFMILLLHILDE
jgi:hypothetical protein